MLHAGLDLSRNRLDVCLLSDQGEIVAEFRSPADRDGLRGLVGRVDRYGEPVRAVVESMTGARFVHDTLERFGWDVLIADAQKAKGLAPLTCKTDKTDARVLAVLSERCLVPEIWLPDPTIRRERELARFRLHLVKHRSALKNRIHSTLINFDERWRQTVDASLHLIDELDFQIAELGKELRTAGAGHRDVPLLMTVPGISARCSPTRSPPRSATSNASKTRRSSPATRGSARRSSSPVRRTGAARSQSTVPSTCAGRYSR